jgi:hypothetical protein
MTVLQIAASSWARRYISEHWPPQRAAKDYLVASNPRSQARELDALLGRREGCKAIRSPGWEAMSRGRAILRRAESSSGVACRA